MQNISHKKVMIFGSFDGLHPGHRYFIEKSATFGDQLYIVLAQDHVITSTKKVSPKYNLESRILEFNIQYPQHTIIKGDETSKSWQVIKIYKPNIIVVGYDQRALKKALEEVKDFYQFKIIQVDAFHPEKYKSSLLRKK